MANRSPEDWRALFEAQAKSGLTAAQFCREQGLCPKYFSLRKRTQSAPAEAGAVPCARSSPFVRVEPVMERGASSPRVRLRLGRCEWELAGLGVGELACLMQALA